MRTEILKAHKASIYSDPNRNTRRYLFIYLYAAYLTTFAMAQISFSRVE